LRAERLEPRLLLTVPTITIEKVSDSSELGPAPAIFRLIRSGGDVEQPLEVSINFAGTAGRGVDYLDYEREAQFAAGADSAYISVLPLNDALQEGTETIGASIASDPAYMIGSQGTVTASLFDHFVQGFGGLWDAVEYPNLSADISYSDARITSAGQQRILTVSIGFSNVSVANAPALDVYLDSDRNPATGDARQGHIAGAEFRIETVLLGFSDFAQVFRLPTQAGGQETLLGQVPVARDQLGLFHISVDTFFLDGTSDANVLAFARRNQPNRVAGNGDRAPDFGWLQSGDQSTAAQVAVPRYGRTVFQTLNDPIGDTATFGTLDIVQTNYRSVVDQIEVITTFAQGFDPTSISHPNVFGAYQFDSDRSAATGGIRFDTEIPSFGGDAQLIFQFAAGTPVHTFQYDPTASDSLVLGETNSDGRWYVIGNHFYVQFSQFAIDPFIVDSTGPVIVPPGIETATTTLHRAAHDGRAIVKSYLLAAAVADAAPDGQNAWDAQSGRVLAPLAFNQPVSAADPLELSPFLPVELTGVAAEVVRDNLIVRGFLGTFLNTTFDANYRVLIDIDSSSATGFRISDPLNPLNTVGADYVMDLFAIDGGIAQVTFANLVRSNGTRTLHEALVSFQPMPVAGTGGSFTTTIPLELLRVGSVPLGDEIRLLVSSGQVGAAGNVDVAPPSALVVTAAPRAPLVGDYNRDGLVDAADYVAWRNTRGQMVTMPFDGADGSGNGTVDEADYGVWRANFGRTAGSGTAQHSQGRGSPSTTASFEIWTPSPFSITKPSSLAPAIFARPNAVSNVSIDQATNPAFEINGRTAGSKLKSATPIIEPRSASLVALLAANGHEAWKSEPFDFEPGQNDSNPDDAISHHAAIDSAMESRSLSTSFSLGAL
jgi:hypothetical protein